MEHTSQTDAFWQEYLATRPVEARQLAASYTVWDFADTQEAATAVGLLVQRGIKTSTSSLVWGLEASGERPPVVGELAVVVDGQGHPLCVIEVTEVTIKPFNAVDAQFAFEYGEGDRTLADWRRENWDFMARWCAKIGRVPTETMPLSCERFRLLYAG